MTNAEIIAARATVRRFMGFKVNINLVTLVSLIGR
jgi:hypothetical protein